MDLPIRSTRAHLKDRGVTLLEILIVIGIMGLFATISTSAYTFFRAHENLAIATTGVVEALRHAAANAQSGKEDAVWGVHLEVGSVVVFKGASYAARDPAFDQALSLSRDIEPSGLVEVTFEKISGKASPVGTITLTSPTGARTISVNVRGTITYE